MKSTATCPRWACSSPRYTRTDAPIYISEATAPAKLVPAADPDRVEACERRICRGCAVWKLVSVCLRFSERGFYGARLGGACFRIPARRTERGFCGMTRGLAGLPPNACAASWARILRGATGWSLLPHTRRTERRFCRMTRGLTELAFVCLRFCECGFCWGAAWKDCFCMSARRTECGFCQMTRGLAGLPPYACAAH